MIKILWIDDQPDRWWPVAKHLDTSKVDVRFAHGFEQIRFELEYREPDIILLDGDMPLMSGEDVAKTFLRERCIPVIIVTMNSHKQTKIEDILSDYETAYESIPYGIDRAKDIALAILRGAK